MKKEVLGFLFVYLRKASISFLSAMGTANKLISFFVTAACLMLKIPILPLPRPTPHNQRFFLPGGIFSGFQSFTVSS